jgi:hypothetical protein
MTCEICGSGQSATHHTREMMLGLGDRFDYSECLGCGRLRLLNPPPDLSRYYPADYYSFAPRGAIGTLKTVLFRMPPVRALLATVHPVFVLDLIRMLNLKPSMKILDVGGGNGALAKELRDSGFRRTLCVDRFASEESDYCRRATLAEAEGQWDVIMFHHSFEHMEDQAGTLAMVKSKVASDGICLLRIPVVSWAWQHYGVDWVQLDAPRHACLHTPRSLELTASQAGFQIAQTIYDSRDFQFWGSELYRAGVPLVEGKKGLVRRFGRKQMQSFAIRAKELNQRGEGDQAAFILRLN